MVQLIELLQVSFAANTAGTQVPTISRRNTVFCCFRSVGMREAYQAMAINRNPEIVAVLADYYDYKDEQYATHGGKVYKIMRTYITGTGIELTLERTRDLDGVI